VPAAMEDGDYRRNCACGAREPDVRSNLGAQRLAGELRRHRHRWWMPPIVGPDAARYSFGANAPICAICEKPRDEVKSKRGRSARSRGNRRELELARALGVDKTGHFGGPDDMRGKDGMFVYQSKVRAAFPTWMTAELAKLPRTGDRVPVLIVTGPPGLDPSDRRKRIAIAVVTLDDWRDLHQETAVPEEETP
jgi:hypothetical protein